MGCGIGRMAIPLTEYLSEEGSYEGFDVVRRGVKWCQENITTRCPNFRFRLADVYNELTIPRGNTRYEATASRMATLLSILCF